MDSFKSRDLHGSENSIPLSPQWLLPKPGENKPGATTGDHPLNCSPKYGSRNEFLSKGSGNGEETFDAEKRKDIWRSTSVEADTIRREHWRDEERDNTSVRRDRWREGDKDLGDHRKSERWSDNILGRSPGEIRRLPSDRWNDGGNRETNFDARRESKWDTRWGREDKDVENRREKWLEPGKDGEMQREKSVAIVPDNSKESEEHNSRPWRSNSLQNRARGEASYLPTTPQNKHAQGFGFGRGRGEMAGPGFTAGRGRGNYSGNSLAYNSSNYNPIGASLERWDTNLRNGSTLKYSRAKLLDIYRQCDMKPSFAIRPDGFTEVPLLTQTEALEPLALSSPSPEEEAIIEGIDRGDIVTSGAPQFSKDGTPNRTRDDVVHNRRQKPGNRLEGISTLDSQREENTEVDKDTEVFSRDLKIGEIRERQPLQHSDTDIEGSKSEELHRKLRDDSRDLGQGSSAHVSGSWRSGAIAEELQGPLDDWQDIKSEIPSQGSDDKDAVWSKSAVSRDHDYERKVPGTKVSKENGMEWHLHEVLHSDSNRLKHQPSVGNNTLLVSEGARVEREKAGTREGIRHIPPEELSLFYKDPQGVIQGPFSGADMIGWFEAGYFGIDLPVRLESALGDTPFACLGDVMPHLRMKARAPPGFGTPKQGDVTDATNANKFGSHGKVQANFIGSGFELSKNEQKGKDTVEAEKSFMESLMSGTFKNPQPGGPVEGGSLGFQGLIPGGTPSVAVESGLDVNYGIGRRMPTYHSVERQKSLPNVFPYPRSAGDPSSLPTNSETVSDTAKPLPQFTTMTSEAPHNISHGNQHGDLMAILQGVSDSSGAKPWATYGDVQSTGNLGHGGLDIPYQDQIDIHHLQRFNPVQSGFPLQHQRQQQQHQPLMQHLMSSPLENCSAGIPLEQLLPSGLQQDPQTLNLIHQQQQQQLLLSQIRLRSQASLPSQVPLLDQILMFQQQKQQQLLPQVLLEQRAHQHLQEPSYDRAQGSGSLGNASADHLMFRQPSDPFMMNAKLPQQVPLPQASVIDNLLHLMNRQGSKGTNLSQQVQLEENLKFNQAALFMQQQTTARESQPSPVWGVTEQDPFAKVQTSSFLPPCELLEKVSKEQQMPHQAGNDRFNVPVSNELSQSIDDSQIAPQVEQIMINSVFPGNVDEKTSTEKDMVTPELLTSSVCDPSVGRTTQQVILEKIVIRNQIKEPTSVLANEPIVSGQRVINDTAAASVTNVSETHEVKKGTERKSRKQKNSKIPSERQKGQSEVTNCQQGKQETENSREATRSVTSEEINSPSLQIPVLHSASQNLQLPILTSISGEGAATDVDSLSRSTSSLTQCAWKPAPCPKPKSLLEIQQEEQKQKAESEKVVSEVAVLSTPTSLPTTGTASWSGAIIGSEKPSRDVTYDVNVAGPSVLRSGSGNLDNGSVRTKKSNLHDLLAEEVLAKTSPQIPEPPIPSNVEKPALLPIAVGLLTPEVSTGDDSEFVEAKDTKKSRKKAAKGKNAAAGKTTTVTSVEPPVPSVPVDKSKNVRQVQQIKEVLPVPPSGPSLGDFLPWKTESSSSPPAQAWSIDMPKLTKTASLREIQKEQEKKLSSSLMLQQQNVASPKVQASRSSSGNSTLWSSPKTAMPTQSIAVPSSSSRSKTEDELFWGPVNPMKQDIEQPEFPSLVTGKSFTPKSSTGKVLPGQTSSRQISAGISNAIKSSDLSSSSTAKGKKQLVSKYSEAKDFRDWCEAELCRLIGNNDTNFLEFCLKQSTSEAEMLLVENLISFDPEREFIDKVLKYKELLPADVIEMAFSRDVQVRSGTNVQSQDANHNGIQNRRSILESRSVRDFDVFTNSNDIDFSAKGGKKKGKKGKKVSPAVLGFSVESTTRIMKGEIQGVDE